MSTVDPIEAALGGQQADPSAAGGAPPEGAAPVDHPVLQRYGGDMAKALDAFQELNSTFGQEGHRLGQENAALRQQLEELQQQAQPAEQAVPDLAVDQLQQWYDEDPVQATAYLVSQGNQVILDQIKQELDQRFKPVEQNIGVSRATQLVENLGKDLGPDVVERNAQVILELRNSDPDLFQGDQVKVYKRVKAMVVAADLEKHPRGASDNGAATSGKGVAVEGGSRGRTPPQESNSELDDFVKALVTPVVENDIFGRPKKPQ